MRLFSTISILILIFNSFCLCETQENLLANLTKSENFALWGELWLDYIQSQSDTSEYSDGSFVLSRFEPKFSWNSFNGTEAHVSIRYDSKNGNHTHKLYNAFVSFKQIKYSTINFGQNQFQFLSSEEIRGRKSIERSIMNNLTLGAFTLNKRPVMGIEYLLNYNEINFALGISNGKEYNSVDSNTDKLIGGRIAYTTPLVTFGVRGYFFSEEGGQVDGGDAQYTVYGIDLKVNYTKFTFQLEYTGGTASGLYYDTDSEGEYLETLRDQAAMGYYINLAYDFYPGAYFAIGYEFADSDQDDLGDVETTCIRPTIAYTFGENVKFGLEYTIQETSSKDEDIDESGFLFRLAYTF